MKQKISCDVQIILDEDYYNNKDFHSTLSSIAEFGFSGIEFNCTNPLHIDIDKLQEVCTKEGLKVINFASGFTAKKKHLSLSSDDEEIRQRTCKAVKKWRRHFDGTDIEIILGFIKSDPRYDDIVGAEDRLKKSFDEILSDTKCDTKLVLEATNHYESHVINKVEEAAQFIADYASEGHGILPDTYHMNIEEVNMVSPLIDNLEYIHKIHFSDNNRYFPGNGKIDFKNVFTILRSLKFAGRIGLEGNIKESLLKELICFPISI